MESTVDCIIPGSTGHTDPNKYLRDREIQKMHMEEDRAYVEKMRNEFQILLDPFKDEFSLFLRSFQQGALHVKPALEDLETRCMSVFSSFGVDIAGVITAMPDMVNTKMSQYRIHRKMEDKMDKAFQADMENAISRNDIGYAVCSDLYDEALQRDWHAAVFSEDCFSQIVVSGRFNRLGRSMGLRVRDLATVYMYLRVMHGTDFEIRVKDLLDLYLRGNFPVRILKKKTLLIATA